MQNNFTSAKEVTEPVTLLRYYPFRAYVFLYDSNQQTIETIPVEATNSQKGLIYEYPQFSPGEIAAIALAAFIFVVVVVTGSAIIYKRCHPQNDEESGSKEGTLKNSFEF